ncbi:CIAPIN1 [Mytilus coruscus]|uniref:CIAPIN1 n=1 Tax=Mytilus coruscus TaxID=42192 RepID=A0A6J7ZYC5_MYTCO|nr:CIAPIN1 [Mytilus coruscus]
MALDCISQKNDVLLLWSGNLEAELLQETVKTLSDKVTDAGSVKVENLDRLQITFDVIVSGIVPPQNQNTLTDQLGEACFYLGPGFTLVIHSRLWIMDPMPTKSDDSNRTVLQCKCKKPDYEVGASTQLKLSFAKKTEPKKVDDNAAKVWEVIKPIYIYG